MSAPRVCSPTPVITIDSAFSRVSGAWLRSASTDLRWGRGQAGEVTAHLDVQPGVVGAGHQSEHRVADARGRGCRAHQAAQVARLLATPLPHLARAGSASPFPMAASSGMQESSAG